MRTGWILAGWALPRSSTCSAPTRPGSCFGGLTRGRSVATSRSKYWPPGDCRKGAASRSLPLTRENGGMKMMDDVTRRQAVGVAALAGAAALAGLTPDVGHADSKGKSEFDGQA